jgi:O-antigen ligase/tetratricopeptide (TPR) repeat protein
VFAVKAQGGIEPVNSSIAIAILGLAGLVFAVQSGPQSRNGLTTVAALLLPAYVAFQLIPLPLFLLRILSPTRAAIAEATRAVTPALHFAPLSIVPAETLVQVSRIAGCVVIFIVIREITHRRPWLPALPLIAVGGFEAAFGLAQQAGGAQQISGSYLNRNHFAGLLEMILPFAVIHAAAVLYRGRKRAGFTAMSAAKACGLLFLALGIFLAITFSLSKSGFVSALVSLLVMGLVGVGSKFSGQKRWAAAAALAALVLLVFVFLPPNELIQKFGAATSDPTAEGRWPIAKDTVHLIGAYPLLGCGLGTYFPGLLPYQTAALTVSWLNAHNDYLQLLAELGIVGFLIPAVLICTVFARATRTALSAAEREARFLGLACVGGLTAMVIHSFTDFNLYVPANAMAFSWITGISAAVAASVRRDRPKRFIMSASVVRKAVLALSCFVGVFAGASLIFFQYFRSDSKAEPTFCRFGICDSVELLHAAVVQHGGDVSAVPPPVFEELLRRDTAGPYRWADLGASLQRQGQIAQARFCFARALTLGPHIPYMLFRSATFHFNLGENTRGLEVMTRAMKADPEQYEQSAFGVYDEKRIPVDEILRYGLPNPHAYQAYLRFVLSGDKIVNAEKAWDWIIAHRYADDKLANEYVEFLIGKKQPEAAEQAWARYACDRDKAYPESNRVFNGDFESDPTESRFDWRIEAARGAAIDVDRAIHYSGSRSLRIQFDGTQNLSSIGLRQNVFLKPGRYRFTAYVRSKDISTDEGIAFRVASEQAPNRMNFTTEPVLVTTNWKLVQHSFVVPQDAAGLADVGLVRTRSLRFDNLIRGTLWVDQVSISPENTDRAQAAGPTGCVRPH